MKRTSQILLGGWSIIMSPFKEKSILHVNIISIINELILL